MIGRHERPHGREPGADLCLQHRIVVLLEQLDEAILLAPFHRVEVPDPFFRAGAARRRLTGRGHDACLAQRPHRRCQSHGDHRPSACHHGLLLPGPPHAAGAVYCEASTSRTPAPVECRRSAHEIAHLVRRRRVLIGLALIAGMAETAGTHRALARAAAAQADAPPFAPQQALATLQVEAGLRVGLFAHEPDTMSPVAMDVDEDGRLFVVEMPGYPLDTQPVRAHPPARGHRRRRPRRPRARLRRRPRAADRRDALEAGRARHRGARRPLSRGHRRRRARRRAPRRAHRLRAHQPAAPRQHARSTVSTTGSRSRTKGRPKPSSSRRRSATAGGPLRFPTRSGRRRRSRRRAAAFGSASARNRIEARSGSSQFGHAFDAWGHYFTLDNSNHARHEVMAARYLERNPDLVIERADAGRLGPRRRRRGVPDHAAAAVRDAERGRPDHVGLQPDLRAERRLAGSASRPRRSSPSPCTTSCTAIATRLPAPPSSPAARSNAREFLASSDPWFRPVNLYLGPDGALYVIDYYRPLIEHPGMDGERSARRFTGALCQGSDRGRIYRVTPEDATLDAVAAPRSVARRERRRRWSRGSATATPGGGARRSACSSIGAATASVPLLERVGSRAAVGVRAAARAVDARGPGSVSTADARAPRRSTIRSRACARTPSAWPSRRLRASPSEPLDAAGGRGRRARPTTGPARALSGARRRSATSTTPDAARARTSACCSPPGR